VACLFVSLEEIYRNNDALTRPMALEECLDSAAVLVEEATARLFRCLKVGMGMQQKWSARE